MTIQASASFHITLSPQRRDDRLHLEKQGTALVINGEVVDLATYDASNCVNGWIVGHPEATEDGWAVTVILPHGPSAPRATRFPAPIVASVDGPIEIPAYDGPDEDQELLDAAVTAKLEGRANANVTANDSINIPKRLTLREMPEGVYFSETASPFDRFPEFGAAVAHVIATASLLDLEMLRPAVSQHGSEALLTVRTAYAALERDERKRRDFIRSMAENTGRELVWETIAWAYEYSKPVFTIRNMFAHHIWGECPALPNTLLLAEPMDRLTGQAALSQLMGHHGSDLEAQKLMGIALGEGGSVLSEADAKTLFEISAARQNSPSRLEAFKMTFGNPLDMRAPNAEVWAANDFRNAAHAANMARTHVLGRLQQISQWLNGLRTVDELEPLPVRTRGNPKR